MKVCNDRTKLYTKVPLKMPLVLQIFPVHACNFRCEFCVLSLPDSKQVFLSEKKYLDFETYQHVIDDVASVREPLKKLVFVGFGEPLLHPEISEMISYARRKNVANTIELLTNGALLTRELTDSLIEAGLQSLRVSIEGLSDEEYQQHAGVKIPFDTIVANVQYYFEKRGSSHVYVKIMDYMVQDSETLNLFHHIFDRISDVAAVEHLHPIIDGIDYKSMNRGMTFSRTQDGEDFKRCKVCPQPFYRLQLNPDGSFVPCCSPDYPIRIKKEAEIEEIWNGSELTSFRMAFLRGDIPEVCKKCSSRGYIDYPEDTLDGHEQELIERIENYGSTN